jgi:hypothetical protein
MWHADCSGRVPNDDAIVVVPGGGSRVNAEVVARIEQKIDTLAAGQAEMRADIGTLKADVGTLKADVRELQVQVADQRVHMGALHEAGIAQIQQVAEGHAALSIQIAKGFEGLHEVIHRRLEPLEQTVRELSIEIRRPRA